uniref:GYF domain-containing protein n=1 Tax=Loa loa TaxID=7209 RepID=A0A1I7W2A0_LOALO
MYKADEAIVSVAAASVLRIEMYTDDITLLSHSASMGLTSRSDYVDEWYYVDPKNAVQGPFPTIHMQAWYKLGYFTPELRVRHGQNPDSSFTTLGELIAMNSEETPFKLKPFQPPVMQLPLQQTQEVSRNIWSRDYSVSLIEAAKVKKERQKLEEEQRRVAEQERQLKEMREALLKEEEERVARERRIMEKELQLQKAQEELAQLAAEEKERSAAREREIEAEKKRLAEEMERTKKEEVERALAETRRKEEEREQQQLKSEAEMRMKKAKELKRIQEETEEATRQTAAEQKRLQQVSQCAAATAREKENLHHKPPTESKKGNTSKEFVVTEEFTPPLRQKGSENTSANWRYSWQATYQSGEEKVAAPKTAPWVAVTNKGMTDRSEPSLLDIQQEEERQMIAEMKHKQQQQINGAAIWKDSGEATRAGVWNSATHKLKWRQDSQPISDVVVPSRQVAWGGAKSMNEVTATKAVWDDPPLSDSGKIKTNRNLQSANKLERGSTEHEAVKKIFKQSVTSSGNALTSWMVNRVKQLNPQVDADVFAAFIEGVDNPNEVEDYIIGYLGESRLVKELIREFLERRSQARQKREPVDKDDLTHPAQAADALSTTAVNSKSDSSTSQQILTGGGKRKKKGNKGSKLVVDGACLGFKGTVDPNRVNVGEIDTVGSGALVLNNSSSSREVMMKFSPSDLEILFNDSNFGPESLTSSTVEHICEKKVVIQANNPFRNNFRKSLCDIM